MDQGRVWGGHFWGPKEHVLDRVPILLLRGTGEIVAHCTIP